MKRILFASLILASCSDPKSDKDKMIDSEMENNQREIDSLEIAYRKGDAKADSIALVRSEMTKY